MLNIEQQYLQLVKQIIETGETRQDRTGTGTKSLFAKTLVAKDVKNNFPLMTHKKMSIKSIASELVWFLMGSTSVPKLRKLNGTTKTIWDEWEKSDGDLGPIYGAQWRGTKEGCVDQISSLVSNLIKNPTSRRMYVSAWSAVHAPLDGIKPHEQPVYHQALSACHHGFQVYVNSKGVLDMMVHIRSADTILGTPYNIASYAMLMHILARWCGYIPGDLTVTLGDAHVYLNHVDKALVMLESNTYDLAKYELDESILPLDKVNIDKKDYSSIIDYVLGQNDGLHFVDSLVNGLIDYKHGPVFSYPVAI